MHHIDLSDAKMVLNTLTVGAAVTPAVIQTYVSHYTNRKPLRQKPTAHISYHEGLKLIRQFLLYASHHTVEELQAFTAQWVPHPRWVKVDRVPIPEEYQIKAADALIAQLGEKGVRKVGGKLWWQWRRKDHELEAEWIEMRNDYNARKRKENDGRRVMLYVHGGAYFFGSTDEHRYQMQRHARKLKARVLAPRYRLAPQFPFPCGLQDCLAAYLYLLTMNDPTDIILAGDSAGGGMVMSILVTLRDQGHPLPAGAILISPWVDLTHSFPSLSGSADLDYIPSHGFMQRPSAAWPPPNDDEMDAIKKGALTHTDSGPRPRASTLEERRTQEKVAVQGFVVHDMGKDGLPQSFDSTSARGMEGAAVHEKAVAPGKLAIQIGENTIELKDQIQMYATNELISHPLVSPVLQASLGGLPPLLILTGGGEILRDEQIYLAHKAANPAKYVPGKEYLDQYDPDGSVLSKYKPTPVQLQVWDDLCHVAPTLSFTRPAKYMYRSIAQFGAWALARAQKTAIDILDDDQVSIISSGSSTESTDDLPATKSASILPSGQAKVGKAGDPLPNFRNHMIRQRVDRHGVIHDLAPESELEALQMPASEIGAIKRGPVEKWMNAKKQWDGKYAAEKRRVQKRRMREMVEGYEGFGEGENPPPSAIASRRRKSGVEEKEKRPRKGLGLMLWSLWGSSHDEDTIHREEKLENRVGGIDRTTTTGDEHGTETTTTNRHRAESGAARLTPHSRTDGIEQTRSRSRRRRVTDAGQTDVSNGIQRPGPLGTSNTADQLDGPDSARTASFVSGTGTLVNKNLASLRPSTNANVETASVLSTSNQSDTASTTAVFAAPGVLKRTHTRNQTVSTIGSDAPEIVVSGDEYESTLPETSRRGSLRSVERLRNHQISMADGDGESVSHLTNGTYTTQDTYPKTVRPGLEERTLSSVAIRRVEGVLKDYAVNGEMIGDAGTSATATHHVVVDGEGTHTPTNAATTIGAATNEHGGERPVMPERDEFVTAQEL